MSQYRSTMTRDAAHAAIEALRRMRALEKQEQIAREEAASREVCERLLRERRQPVLEYAI